MASGHTVFDAAKAASAMLGGAARRLRHGPERASWSWMDELVVHGLRGAFHDADDRPVDVIRRQFDRVGWAEAARMRSTWRTSTLGGVDVAWVGPRRGGRDVAFFLHGGGYVFGSPRSHRVLMADLAVAADIEVVGVDYRLAPEHPCPAAIDDVLSAYRALLNTQAADRVVWVGDSAGAGLGVVALQAAQRLGLPMPAGLVCMSPWVDLTCSGDSHRTNASADYIGVANVIEQFASAYAGSIPRDDPRLSPVLHPLEGMVPLRIQVGSAEILLDDATLLAERARAAGVDVELQIWEDGVHVWHAFSMLLPRSREAIDGLATWMRALLP